MKVVTVPFRVRYFGCVGRSGHYLWEPGYQPNDPPCELRWQEIRRLPWKEEVDARLCPKGALVDEPEGGTP